MGGGGDCRAAVSVFLFTFLMILGAKKLYIILLHNLCSEAH